MEIKFLVDGKKAIEKIREALKKDPNNSNLLTRLGALHFAIFHEIFELPNILKKAIDLDPSNDEAMFWLAKYFVHYTNDSKQAQKYLRAALKINPQRADCYSLLGHIMLSENDLDSAIEHLKKATNYSTSWFTPRYGLAKALLAKGKLVEAKKVIEEGLKFTRLIHLRDRLVENYYTNVTIGNDDEITRDYVTNNKSQWQDLLKSIDEKIKKLKSKIC